MGQSVPLQPSLVSQASAQVAPSPAASPRVPSPAKILVQAPLQAAVLSQGKSPLWPQGLQPVYQTSWHACGAAPVMATSATPRAGIVCATTEEEEGLEESQSSKPLRSRRFASPVQRGEAESSIPASPGSLG